MTPEQLKDFETMKSQLSQVVEFINKLGSVESVPYEIESALKARLGTLSISSKTASTEYKAVDESGSASYNVSNPMDGFAEAKLNGQTVYIPYYT